MDKKRILLVDDEPDVTQLLKLCLEKTGAYEVREENRGERALAAARAFKPDLILLDIMMPAMDGAQVAAQLKADEKLKDTPVVFLSAVVAKEEAQKQQGVIGGRPFIAKPASPEEVTTAIEKYLPKGTEVTPMREKTSEQNKAGLRAKKRILLIDDDPDLTGLLKMYLENTGAYEVREENRSEQAYATARAFRPDLIFLDIMMPNVLGGKVADQLDADEELKETPVVFLSAVVGKEEAQKQQGMIGGHPFIAKPASPEEVTTAIEKYLSKGKDLTTMREKTSEQNKAGLRAKKRILLIDDDPDLTGLLKIYLENTGTYEVKEENNSEHAVATARAFRPDLIFLDMMMPNVLGGKVAGQLEAEEDLKDTPVVFLSAVVTEDATGREAKIAGRPAVAKPVTPDTLVSLIEKYLPKKILLVDDDDNESARLKINIERTTDYEALVAATGEAALMLVKTRNPDFVLLNTRMPAMDGLEMLKRINAIAPGIPVAMMTDVHKPGEAKQYIDAGALDYITKPIDLEHLKATLLASLLS